MSSVPTSESQSPIWLDPVSPCLFLHVPPAKVVLFQSFFETYEGIGVLRTMDSTRSLLMIMTTASMLEDCLHALESMQAEIEWRTCPPLSELEIQQFLGYFLKS